MLFLFKATVRRAKVFLGNFRVTRRALIWGEIAYPWARLAVMTLLLLLAMRVTPFGYRVARFYMALNEMARRGASFGAEPGHLQQSVYERALGFGFRLQIQDVHVEYTDDRWLRIRARYDAPLDLWLYATWLHFEPEVVQFGVRFDKEVPDIF